VIYMAVENRPSASSPGKNWLSGLALVLAIIALVVAVVLPMQIATGPQGPKGDKGDPGALSWGTPSQYGPYVLEIGIGTGSQLIPGLSAGDRVQFSFSASGSDVSFWVHDPYGNAILIGNSPYETGAQATSSGYGAFIAAASGTYRLAFKSSGIVTPSVIVINYTVYPA
jgi:hypothetical protein